MYYALYSLNEWWHQFCQPMICCRSALLEYSRRMQVLMSLADSYVFIFQLIYPPYTSSHFSQIQDVLWRYIFLHLC